MYNLTLYLRWPMRENIYMFRNTTSLMYSFLYEYILSSLLIFIKNENTLIKVIIVGY